LSNTLLNNGSININGENINIIDGSSVLISNIGAFQNDGINISANGQVTISGAPETFIPKGFAREISGIISSNLGQALGANINIKARNFLLDKSGIVFSNSYNLGKGGDINLNILDSIDVIEAPLFPSAGSLIAGVSFGPGKSGNINIFSRSLNVKEGATIATDSLSSGDTGNVNIESNSISLTGYNSKTLSPSKIITLSSGNGKGGNEFIKAKNLFVNDGGRIESSTIGKGDAGSLFIDSQIIRVKGSYPAPINNKSTIGSSAILLNPETISVYDIDGRTLNGKSGDVTINSSLIELIDGGQITVINDGTNDAGNLRINADLVRLQNGEILASTQGGNGGIVEINTKSLLMQNSNIFASAKRGGNGGDVTINSNIVAGDSSSLISANAEQGDGGFVKINTKGLIFNPNNITATSEKGSQYNGSININATTLTFTKYPNLVAKIDFTGTPISCNIDSKKKLRVVTANDLEMSDDQLESFSIQNKIPRFLNKSGKIMLLIEVQGWIPTGNNQAQTVAFIGNPIPNTAIASGCQIFKHG
jgi:large exoprotein involved in heme utilization and adhesion